MGTYNCYHCTSCRTRVELGGPEEFRTTLFGKKVPEPHIGGTKINGLWITLWCPSCRRTEKKVMIEFTRTCSPIEVWGHTAPIKPEYRLDDPTRYNCSECSEPMLDTIPPDATCSCGGAYQSDGTIQT